MRIIISLSSIIILVLVGCEGVDTAPNANESASLVAEYDWMEDNNLLSTVPSIFNHVKDSFSKVGMQAHFYKDKERIPPFNEYNSNYLYFPDNDNLLREYARHFDSDTLFWHLLSVDKFEINQSGGPLTYGIAAQINYGEENSPINPAEDRFSIIFTEDIITHYIAYSDEDNIPAALITTVVHELGHQRAGLTHANQCPQYHHFLTFCVMDPGSSVSEDPEFCEIIDPNDPLQESSCKKIVEENYDNF